MRTSKGTAQSKVSGTTLTIPSFTVLAGHSLVVGAAYANGAGAPSSVKHNGRSLRLRKQQDNASQGIQAGLWLKAEYHNEQTGSLVITWDEAIVERVAWASSWDYIRTKDKDTGKAETSTTDNPGTGLSATLDGSSDLVVACFGVDGPAGDWPGSATARVDDGGVWQPATIGQTIGTTGGGAVTNVSAVEVYYDSLGATDATRAQIQSAVSRRWANVLLALRERPTFNNQGITPTDTGAVEAIVAAAGGDTDDITYHKNTQSGLWEAYEDTALGTLRATRGADGEWS